MSYGTLADLRAYLSQVPAGTTEDALLADVLDRATAVVDTVLGYSYASYPAASSQKVRGAGGPYLIIPPHQLGTVSAVSLNGDAVTDYTELAGGTLYRVSSLGYPRDWYTYYYDVTAVYGYGAAPTAVVEVTLELAVSIWKAKDAASFTDVVGVDGGGAVGYQRALTDRQRMILTAERNKHRRPILV